MPYSCVSMVLGFGVQSASNLVDLGPAIFDAGDVIESRTVFPKRTAFDIKDERYGGKVHVSVFV